jgi:plasmid stabilization system protein ParE
MRLEWSIFALSDREAIFDTVEMDSPRAAVSIDDRIEMCVERLSQFP